MTEQSSTPPSTPPGTGPSTGPSIEPGPTGDARVDAVLERLEGLEQAGVDDQVAALERAHDELRSALASASDDPDSCP